MGFWRGVWSVHVLAFSSLRLGLIGLLVYTATIIVNQVLVMGPLGNIAGTGVEWVNQ
jgi:hypothetical protein